MSTKPDADGVGDTIGAGDVLDVSATEVVRYPPNGRLQVPLRTRRGASAAVATSMACKRAPTRAAPRCRAVHVAVRCARAAGFSSACRRRYGARGRGVRGVSRCSWTIRRGGLGDAPPGGAHWPARLLLRDDAPVAFVKAAPQGSGHGLEVERNCLSELSGERDAPVLVPKPLGGGLTASNISWTAMQPLPPRPHRPAWRGRSPQ